MGRFGRKKIVLSALLLISLVAANELHKRMHFSYSTGNVYIEFGFETGPTWMGMVAAVCRWCGQTNACCIWGAVAASFATSYVRVAEGNTSGSESQGTTAQRKREDSLLNQAGFPIALDDEISSKVAAILSTQNLTLHTVIDPSSVTYNKRDNAIDSNPIIIFQSQCGNHNAVAVTYTDPVDLAYAIVNATPGVPSISNSTLSTRDQKSDVPGGDGFTVEWVSYNYDNVNRDVALRSWTYVVDYDKMKIQNWIATMLMNHRGWKFCVSVGQGSDNSDSAVSSGKTPIGMHGELYFNTYGGIDNECNNQLIDY